MADMDLTTQAMMAQQAADAARAAEARMRAEGTEVASPKEFMAAEGDAEAAEEAADEDDSDLELHGDMPEDSDEEA